MVGCSLCGCFSGLNGAGLCGDCWETVNWFSMRSTN